MDGTEGQHSEGGRRRIIAFGVALAVFAGVLATKRPETLDPLGQRALAVTLLMAVLWVTEALPIPVTALLPLLLFPLLRVMPSDRVASEYANDLIFLFFGGFFIALTLEKWNVHRRLALLVMSLFGTKPSGMILGVMTAVATLSMWITNTATTLMMLPICLAMIDQLGETDADPKHTRRFGVALLLGTAYAANVGGMGTPIGTGPNGVFLRQFPGPLQPSFAQWMVFGLPLVAVFTLVIWLMLTRVLFPLPRSLRFGDRDFVRVRLAALGRPRREEKAVLAVFGATVALWIFRRDIDLGAVEIPGWVSGLRALGLDGLAASARTGVGDSAVSVLAVLLLCTIRVRGGDPPLADWSLARRLPWGTLLLLGGGFAVARGFQVSADENLASLSEWIGGGIDRVADSGELVLLPLTSFVLSFLTELTSNTATSAVTLPILAEVGTPQTGRLLALAACLSASCAFMFPVATPPNAIVFASGRVKITTMMRAGIWLNLIGVVLVSATVWLIARQVLPG